MPTIYRKTAKGVAEIETRAHRLMPRIRSALILVDGKRDTDDLKLLVTIQADECLQALVEQGFIEAVGETMKAAQSAEFSGAAATAAPLPPQPLAAANKPTAEMEGLRRSAVRALNDALGPSAESLSIRIERARSLEELQPLFAQGAKLLLSARGPAAAADFALRFPAN